MTEAPYSVKTLADRTVAGLQTGLANLHVTFASHSCSYLFFSSARRLRSSAITSATNSGSMATAS